MGLMSGIAGGILRQMPIVDARHQRDTENERADIKQKMWLAQQQRQQDEYERKARERKANTFAAMNPQLVKGLMSGEIEIPVGPLADPALAEQQQLYDANATLLNTIGHQKSLADEIKLKRAGLDTSKMGKPLATFSANGRRLQPTPMGNGVWKNVDVGEDTKKSLVDMRRESAFSQGMGRLGAEKMKRLEEKARESKALLGDLQLILDSKSKAGGPGAGFWLGTKQALHRMGVPVKDLSQDELLMALGNQFAVAARGGAFSGGKPLTGNTSDADMQRLYASVPSLAQTPEGRKLIAEMLKSKATFNINEWKAYQNQYIKKGNEFKPYAYSYETDEDADKQFQKLLEEAERIAAKAPSNPAVTVNPNQKPGYAASLVAPFNKGGAQNSAQTGAPAQATNNKPTHRKYDPRTGTFTVVR